ILSSQGVGQLLQTLGRRTLQKSIRRLLEVDVLFAQAIREPVMLVEAHPGRERKIGAHAHEHAAPALVVDIEVVLNDPAIRDLQMPAVCFPVTDRDHDPRRLSGFEDDDDLIRACSGEVGLDKIIAATLWSLDDRGVPLVGLSLHPDLKLVGGATQHVSADRIEVPIGIEEPDHSLGLLKRLDQPIEEYPIKASIAEPNAVLVMFVEGVHGRLPRPEAGTIVDRHLTLRASKGQGYQGQSPWLVLRATLRHHVQPPFQSNDKLLLILSTSFRLSRSFA